VVITAGDGRKGGRETLPKEIQKETGEKGRDGDLQGQRLLTSALSFRQVPEGGVGCGGLGGGGGGGVGVDIRTS